MRKVTAVLREGGMRTSYDGLDVSLEDKLYEDADKVQPNDLDELTKFLNEDYNGNHVIVDCSASQEVSDYYAKWMRSGIHVIRVVYTIQGGRSRAGRLQGVRSRLYRRRILQSKAHLKALAEIYTIHTFLLTSDLKMLFLKTQLLI